MSDKETEEFWTGFLHEWTLKFVLEEQEAQTRFSHIVTTLQADANVFEVEVSEDTSEPEIRVLVVRFKPGLVQPANRVLHHLDKIHGTTPIMRRSRYDRLLESTDVFDD